MGYTRLFDIMPYQLATTPKDDCLTAKQNGNWRKYSTEEVCNTIDKLAKSLMALGIQHHTGVEEKCKIAIISNNRPEWNFVDNAITKIGAVNVPIYPNITNTELEFIFNDAGITYAFVSDAKLYENVKSIWQNVPTLKEVYTFETVAGAAHWQDLLLQSDKVNDAALQSVSDTILDTELATIIYTSGTTGFPKGVMLCHKNIVSNIQDCMPILMVPLSSKDRAISFLPLCHIFERMVSFLFMASGVSIYYAESLETIAANIKEIQPQVFTTVPRLLEKVYDKIYAKGNELTGIKRSLFMWALNLGLQYEHGAKNGWCYELQLKLANKLIFNKWRDALGNNIKIIVSGGAALQPRLARIFTAANMMVLEGYGLSETSPVICVNRPIPGESAFTTVGPVINNVQVKLAEDGEICVKGNNVMMGYYKQPSLTQQTFDADGYFLTGDIGEWIDGKFLKITDRKKDIFKTSGGKYVSPQAVENKLKESIYIDQACVVGENQKFAGALIVPAFAEIRNWLQANKLPEMSNEEICNNAEVKKLIASAISKTNEQLSSIEKVKCHYLIREEWTIQGGMLTPSMKVKRKVLMKKYENEINEMFK